jgi:4-amino-4-deoxy-L-arabinose transferase-like glycosyltransferase
MRATSRTVRLVIVGLIAAWIYLPGLGRPALWEPDEGRYGEIAREMVVTGDYVTPRNNFELYFEKPPLVYWANAAAIRVFGANEFAVRLPAALFSIGQVVVTAAITETIFGAAIGILAALALALSPIFFVFARFATLDPALAFFLTAALGAFIIAARAGSFSDRAARNWILTAAALLALGTLAKGPVAIFLGAAIALVWLALEHRLRDVARMPLLWSAIIYVAIVAPWFIAIELRNPGFLQFFFIHEHLSRYLASREHGWGPWFFVPIVAAGTWPWLYFAPCGWFAMRTAMNGSQSQPTSAGHSSDARFFAVWFVAIFVFFSIPRSKLGTYILPALPPLAIFAGYGLSQIAVLDCAWRRVLLHGFTIVNLALAGAAIFVLSRFVFPVQPDLARDGIELAVGLGVGAATMDLIANRTRFAGYAFIAIAVTMFNATRLVERGREHAASLYTYRNLAHTIAPYLAPDCVLGSYRHYIQSIPFYTQRRETRVVYRGELSEVAPASAAKSVFLIGSDARLRDVWSSAACMIIIANDRDLPALKDLLKPAPVIVGCEGKKFALYKGAGARAAAGDPADCLNRASPAR